MPPKEVRLQDGVHNIIHFAPQTNLQIQHHNHFIVMGIDEVQTLRSNMKNLQHI